MQTSRGRDHPTVGTLGRVISRLRAAVAPRLAGAVLLGVATLLGPKADPSEHWAVPPRTDVVEIVEDVGEPDPLDAMIDGLAGPPTRGDAA